MDIELVKRWQEDRDEGAVVQLWQRYHRLAISVAGHVLRRHPDPQAEAGDVVDGCFLRALTSFDPSRVRHGHDKAFRNWLLRLVRHAAIDRARRTGRLEYRDAEGPEVVAPTTSPDAPLDLARVMPQLQEYVLSHFLRSDWALVESWMAYQREGQAVPWKQLAERHVLTIELIVHFRDGSAAFELATLDPVVRLLDRCIGVCVEVVGTYPPADGDERKLAVERSRRVCEVVQQSVRNRVVTARGTAERRERVTWTTQEGGGGRVWFRVVEGAERTPAALRMRVTKVILPRARAHLESLEPGLPRELSSHVSR